MSARILLPFFLCVGSMAAADCAPELEPFLYCQMEDGRKEVEVCFDGSRATYRFGPIGGTPELALDTFISEGANYFPWQGVGREIAEGIDFYVGTYRYAAYGGFDRMTAADETIVSHFGGIRVFQNDAVIAELRCKPETVEWAY